MQIIPTTHTTSQANDFFSGMGAVEAQQTAASFAALFAGHAGETQNAVRQNVTENTPAIAAAVDNGRNALDTSARSALRESTGSSQNQSFRQIEKSEDDGKQLKMTSLDFAKVKESLAKYGLSKKDIEELEERVNSKGGLTWGAFVSALMQKTTEMAQSKTVNTLSVGQKQDLDQFFQNIGYSAQESSNLIKDLEKGKFTDILAVVQKKLDSVPKDKLLELSPKGVHALAEAMNLSDETKQQLTQLLSSGEREVFLPGELKSALALIQKEDAQRLKDLMQTTKDLQKDIASALRSAKESALGGDGDSDRAKLIKTDKDENLVDRFLGKDAKTAADKDQASDPLKAVHDHKDGEKDAKGEHKEGEKAETKTKAQDDLLAKNGRDAKADKDDPLGWKSFWERVEDKTDARHMLGNNADQTAAKTNQQPLPEAKAERYSDQQRIIDQLQSAIGKNLGNGTSRLTLQLEPENLGTVNLTIQVQGKEVRALIRTEHQDVTQALHDQLSQVKQTLEQQGLKVAELEVRTGLSDASLTGNNWMTADQHNREQERQAMAEMRSRIRNLRSGDIETVREALADIRRSTGDNGLHLIA